MAKSRRAVFVCCDGLGRDWVRPETTPFLAELRDSSLVVRRTQCGVSLGDARVGRLDLDRLPAGAPWPAWQSHGPDGGGQDRRPRRRRTGFPHAHAPRHGTTLLVPSIAERVAEAGGFIAFSNVSPGAAYFLDPEHFGHIHHRAGSFAPGGESVGALEVTHDSAGDWTMAQRFCAEVLSDAKPAVAFLWICDPDHTLHAVPLGSPAHLDVLRQADRCVAEVHRTVERLRSEGEEILLLVGSDHGHETIGDSIDVEEWLAAHGLKELLSTGDVAVAGQGTSALLYATDRGRAGLLGVIEEIRRAPWAADVLVGADLAAKGFTADGVVAAVDTARQDEANPHGVPGRRWMVKEGKAVPIGCGQHGGLGPDETRPFLMLNDGGRSSGTLAAGEQPDGHRTDHRINYLGLPLTGFDGSPPPTELTSHASSGPRASPRAHGSSSCSAPLGRGLGEGVMAGDDLRVAPPHLASPPGERNMTVSARGRARSGRGDK